MRKTIIALAVAAALALPACGALLELGDNAAERAGKAIAEYCKLPAETRDAFRAMVAERAAPHSAHIYCVAP